MKTTFHFISKLVILQVCMLFVIQATAQNSNWPYFNLEIRNDVQVSPTEYQFDIYLLHTGNYTTPVYFETSGFQVGLLVNDSIRNGGTFSDSLVPGSNSELSPYQRSIAFGIYDATPNKCLRITGQAASIGMGTIISKIGLGTKLMRVRLINSVPFANARPNLTLTAYNNVGYIYPTKINARIGAVSTNISAPTNGGYNQTNITSSYNNPLLNSSEPNLVMTGDGKYCPGGTPVILRLPYSFIGTNYQLLKDGLNYGTALAGTGAALNWNVSDSGTYTCITSHAIILNGSAVVTTTSTATPTGAASQAICNGATVADLVATGSAIKWYDASLGGNVLLSSDILISGNSYYASQTAGGCESVDRFGVTVLFNPTPGFTVTTKTITNISFTTATFNGELTATCLNPTLSRGFVCARHADPRLGDATTRTINSGSGIGVFSSNVAYLEYNTIYWVRAFETDASGITYGELITFKTNNYPSFNLELRNDSMISDHEYEFDVYLLHTGDYVSPPQFELASVQMGLGFSSTILNGGTVTPTIVPGSTDEMNPSQRQTNSNLFVSGPMSGSTDMGIKVIGTSQGIATIINTTIGTRVMRLRLTNSVPFKKIDFNVKLILWNPTISLITKAWAYIGGTVIEITSYGTYISHLSHPLYMTGGGTYCAGSSSFVVGVDSTFIGSNYQLMKDGLNYGAIKAGTGHALSWIVNEAGNYTCVSGTTNVNGTAVVSIINTPAPTGDTAQLICDRAMISNLLANGTDIKWYDAPTGGNLFSSTDTLINGNRYYASQTLNACESQSRLAVRFNNIKTLHLRLFLEGLFDISSGNTMLEAQDVNWNNNATYAKFGSGIADQIDLELHQESAPYNIMFAQNNLNLSTAGYTDVNIPCENTANYYIAIKNRNHLQTWSALAVPFNTSAINYDFTTSATSAYQASGGGNPQAQVGNGVFAFYCGDLNQSMRVDFDDFNLFEPFMTGLTYGYTIADINGNALVDFDDFNIFEPRLNEGPFAQYPGMP